MEKGRLSVSSSSGVSVDDSVSTTASTPEPYQPPEPIYVAPNIQSVVVNKGGTAVHNGDVNSFTVNTYIVSSGDDWDPDTVKGLVKDAITVTNKQINLSDNLLGNKDDALSRLQRRWCLLIGSLVILSLLTLLSTVLFSLSTRIHHRRHIHPTGLIIAGTDDISSDFGNLPGAPRVIQRTEWLAMPPTKALDNNTLPVERIVVCHTANEFCSTTPSCILAVRYVQQFHVESKKWNDIGYNFLIGGDGCVYEGRGWNKMGAHSKGNNNGTLGVAFIGTYVKEMPNPSQIEAFNKLIDVGLRIGKIAHDYSLVSQCQLQVTAAPGLALANNMTSWPHYDDTLPIQCTIP